MKTYSTYLFDADGTLIDTQELIYQCFVHTCGMFSGKKVERAEVLNQVGLPLTQNLRYFLGPIEPSRLEQARVEHMRYQLEIYQGYLKIFPDVKETLAALKAKGKKLGVVTSRMMQTLKLYLDQFGIYGYFDVFITPADTLNHKPDPEPVLEALKKLNVTPKHVVFVGDAEYDIECGQRAGVDTAFVSWSHLNPDTFKTRPDARIASMKELL